MQTTSNGHALAELVVAHSSDLHLGGRWHGDGELSRLRAVIEATREAGAHALILAGDVFDNNRVHEDVVTHAAAILAAAPLEVIILPGNHDPATDDTVYRRPALHSVTNIHVLGVNVPDLVRFASLDLEVWGVPHTSYADMTPLPAQRLRSMRWHIAVAHGHWVTGPHDAHRGWLIHDHEIGATQADYVALGHWDRAAQAGDGSIPAYYSGSPDLAKSVNIARFSAAGVTVTRHPLKLDA